MVWVTEGGETILYATPDTTKPMQPIRRALTILNVAIGGCTRLKPTTGTNREGVLSRHTTLFSPAS